MTVITIDAVLPAQLYELFDADDVLLYVGVATNLGYRLSSHRAEKPWWGEVARVAAVTHVTKAEALKAEQEMIRERKPKYNVIHSDVNERRAAAHQIALGPDVNVYLSLTEFAARVGVQPATLAKYKLPDPDAVIGTTRGWSEATVDKWQANRPGKGAGAGRKPKQTGSS